MFFKIGVLKNVARFTGKHQCWSLFFIKLHALRACNVMKKRFRYRCFLVKLAKILGTPFFTEHLRWLLQLFSKLLFNPFHATGLSLYPLKTSENQVLEKDQWNDPLPYLQCIIFILKSHTNFPVNLS